MSDGQLNCSLFMYDIPFLRNVIINWDSKMWLGDGENCFENFATIPYPEDDVMMCFYAKTVPVFPPPPIDCGKLVTDTFKADDEGGVLVVFSASGKIRTGRKLPVCTAYFPVLA